MSDDSRKGEGEPREREDRPAARATTWKVAEQMGLARQVLETLHRSLAACRSRCRGLEQERNELLRILAELEPLRVEHEMAEERRRALEVQTDDKGRMLRQQHEIASDLAERCSRLEGELAEERHQNRYLAEELACLEEQVEQLGAMVDLLSAGLQEEDEKQP